jgi:hypothetical protein
METGVGAELDRGPIMVGGNLRSMVNRIPANISSHSYSLANLCLHYVHPWPALWIILVLG